MITINLTPEEELENRLWFLPDVAILVASVFVSYLLVSFHFSSIHDEIAEVKQDSEKSENGYRLLRDDQSRHESLEQTIRDLDARVLALTRITSSKLVRYRPVIILEHLQNLRPEGVWFEDIELLREGALTAKPDQRRGQAASTPNTQTSDSDAGGDDQGIVVEQVRPLDVAFDSITIRGMALDNVLVAEFMSALKATQTQDVDPGDLRTQVYFAGLTLLNTRLVEFDLTGDSEAQSGAETQNPRREAQLVAGFQIDFHFREHAVGSSPFDQVSDNFASIFPAESSERSIF